MSPVNTQNPHVTTDPAMETVRALYGWTRDAVQDLMSVMKKVGAHVLNK